MPHFCIQYLLNSKNNNNPSQSSSLSNTITGRRELVTRLGRRLLFPTPSSSLAAAIAVHYISLQRLCQVKNRTQASIYFLPGGETITLKHRGGCGIPDGETIVMTGCGVKRPYHNYVTRCGKLEPTSSTSGSSLSSVSDVSIVMICIHRNHLHHHQHNLNDAIIIITICSDPPSASPSV